MSPKPETPGKPTEKPEHPHGAPPGQVKEPGQPADPNAPGQQKPKPDQGLPEPEEPQEPEINPLNR